MRWPVELLYSLGLWQTRDCSPGSPHWKPESLPLAFSLPAIPPESGSQQVAEPLEGAPNALTDWWQEALVRIGVCLTQGLCEPDCFLLSLGWGSTRLVRWYPRVSHPGFSSRPSSISRDSAMLLGGGLPERLLSSHLAVHLSCCRPRV